MYTNNEQLGKEGRNTIPIEQYGQNLRRLVSRLKGGHAQLIFCDPNNVHYSKEGCDSP